MLWGTQYIAKRSQGFDSMELLVENSLQNTKLKLPRIYSPYSLSSYKKHVVLIGKLFIILLAKCQVRFNRYQYDIRIAA